MHRSQHLKVTRPTFAQISILSEESTWPTGTPS